MILSGQNTREGPSYAGLQVLRVDSLEMGEVHPRPLARVPPF